MLRDIKKVGKKVKAILTMCPETRNSDKELFREYFKREVQCQTHLLERDKELIYIAIDWLIENTCSFESVSRVRRDIQKEYKELRSDKQIAKAREEEEKAIERYYMRSV